MSFLMWVMARELGRCFNEVIYTSEVTEGNYRESLVQVKCDAKFSER